MLTIMNCAFLLLVSVRNELFEELGLGFCNSNTTTSEWMMKTISLITLSLSLYYQPRTRWSTHVCSVLFQLL